MQLTPELTKKIGSTIRAVTEAQSKRFFKSEVNNLERSAMVYFTIRAEVELALRDAGIPLQMIMGGGIDPTDDILKQMKEDGYLVGDISSYEGVPQ